MSKDGWLPPGVTHKMIDDQAGPEDEGVEIDLADGTVALVQLCGEILTIEIASAFFNDEGIHEVIYTLELYLAQARALSLAIAERVM